MSILLLLIILNYQLSKWTRIRIDLGSYRFDLNGFTWESTVPDQDFDQALLICEHTLPEYSSGVASLLIVSCSRYLGPIELSSIGFYFTIYHLLDSFWISSAFALIISDYAVALRALNTSQRLDNSFSLCFHNKGPLRGVLIYLWLFANNPAAIWSAPINFKTCKEILNVNVSVNPIQNTCRMPLYSYDLSDHTVLLWTSLSLQEDARLYL